MPPIFSCTFCQRGLPADTENTQRENDGRVCCTDFWSSELTENGRIMSILSIELLLQFGGPLKHRIQHLFGQSAGERVLLAGVVAAQ